MGEDGERKVSKLVFVGNTALVDDSKEKFCSLVRDFGSASERRKLKVSVGKSKY